MIRLLPLVLLCCGCQHFIEPTIDGYGGTNGFRVRPSTQAALAASAEASSFVPGPWSVAIGGILAATASILSGYAASKTRQLQQQGNGGSSSSTLTTETTTTTKGKG